MQQTLFTFSFLGGPVEAHVSKTNQDDREEYHVIPEDENVRTSFPVLVIRLEEDGKPVFNLRDHPRSGEYTMSVWQAL